MFETKKDENETEMRTLIELWAVKFSSGEKAEEGERKLPFTCWEWNAGQCDRLQVVFRSIFAQVTVKTGETLNLQMTHCWNFAWHKEVYISVSALTCQHGRWHEKLDILACDFSLSLCNFCFCFGGEESVRVSGSMNHRTIHCDSQKCPYTWDNNTETRCGVLIIRIQPTSLRLWKGVAQWFNVGQVVLHNESWVNCYQCPLN